MKKRFAGIAIAMSAAVFSMGAQAGPNPYSDCGIGAAIFKDTPWAAAISNATWDLGTTAVASATMSPETCTNNNVRTAQLIIDTYDSLAEDTARGEGKFLSAALDSFGCEAGDQGAIATDLRATMAVEFGKPGYADQTDVEKATQFYQALDTAAGGKCATS